MTDITELAQHMKAAAVRAKAATEDYVAHRMSITVCLEECKEFNDLSDGPDNILALVEELEKSELRLHEVAVACATAEQALEKAQTERDEFRRRFNLERSILEDADKDLEELRQRIADLESRTVKLVDCDFGAVQHMSGGSTDYCHGFVDGTQNAVRAITAAGIKVEAE